VDDEGDEETAPTGRDLRATLQTKRACLTVLTGAGAGMQFPLPNARIVIGRAPTCEIRLQDDGVSRQHAAIWFDSERMWVTDLESRNGTMVNDERITKATLLREGDKLQIGRSSVLRFGYQDELDHEFHENLLSSALRDSLTKLFNKRYLLDRLDAEIKFARRHSTSVSLLMFDIDHFKHVNDRHGHLAGDAVLVQLAELLTNSVRDEDVVARFGGDEIAMILRAIPADAAMELAGRLRRLVENTVTVYQQLELKITVSVGVGSFPSSDRATPQALIEDADKALYRAKGGGRNRVSR
jgi:two-component system, cell cycle response regulator